MNWPLQRGKMYLAKLGDQDPKYFLVVSNNMRNSKLTTALAVRITTTNKGGLPAAVQLSPNDSLAGWAYCDDIVALWEDEILKDAGAASPATMKDVDRALRHALGLSQP